MEDAELKELVRNLANTVAALATRVERGTFQTTRIANASEETNAFALNEVRESKVAHEKTVEELKEIRSQLAVIIDNVKDAEDAADEAKVAVREATNKFPKLEDEIDAADKLLLRLVKGAFRPAWVRIVSLLGGGTLIGGLLHWLKDHFGK